MLLHSWGAFKERSEIPHVLSVGSVFSDRSCGKSIKQLNTSLLMETVIPQECTEIVLLNSDWYVKDEL